MGGEGIFTIHLTGTQFSLLQFLVTDIELVFNSARPDFKLGYQVISLVLGEFNFWILPFV